MTEFSVIIPTLSTRHKLLLRSLQSVLNQSISPLEVIIVGADYLPDIRDFIATSKFIPSSIPLKILAGEKKLNASEARNLGASVSSGEWLAFLDDDDYWHENYLQIVHKNQLNDRTDAIVGDLYSVNLQGQIKKISRNFRLRDLYLYNPGVTGSNFSIRRDVFATLGGFSTSLTVSQDKALVLELLKASFVLTFADGAIAFNCQHELPRLTNPRTQLIGYFEFYRQYRKEMSFRDQVKLLKKIAVFWWNSVIYK